MCLSFLIKFSESFFLLGILFSSRVIHGKILSCFEEESLIVQFNQYIPQKEHLDLLSNVIGLFTHNIFWEWESRENPATHQFPSDFAIINVCRGSNHIRSSLEQSFLVKGVHRQDAIRGKRKLSGVEFPVEKADYSSTNSHKISNNHHQNVNDRSFSFVGESPQQQGSSRSLHQNLRGSRKIEISPGLLGEHLWEKGFSGKGVKVAVFDTGVSPEHGHFDNIVERINWTNEETLEDGVGHGTFVSGVIGGADARCPGFAPDAELFIFRVFTKEQVSYTSWFLDAFNYAIFIGVDILNLSIGGPDTGDWPFIEKVWEVTANGITIVSAVGNDGPKYGTMNNPADQLDTIGVGAVTPTKATAAFQSRGMTSWDFPSLYGRVKPDIRAFGMNVLGPMRDGSCKALSGTSVASPVIAGALALLMSTVSEERKLQGVINPASMKQILIEGAELSPTGNIFEQGSGLLDVMRSYEILQQYEPRASIFPSALDFTNCPYMWPYCEQPFYAGAEPIIFNATIMNGIGLTGMVTNVEWVPKNEEESILNIKVQHSDIIWPWFGYFAVSITVLDEFDDFTGMVEGFLDITIKAYNKQQDTTLTTNIALSVKVDVIPTPPRHKRIIWDQFHNIKYPSGYVPRDDIENEKDMLDWNGDHVHTNYGALYMAMVSQGFYVEILNSDLTCLDASKYGALIMMDAEEEFYEAEMRKLKEDITEGLSVLVVADWYNLDFLKEVEFFDDNTRSQWKPIIGGANVPALNELLDPFGISLGSKVFTGTYVSKEDKKKMELHSATTIIKAPRGASLLYADLIEMMPMDNGESSVSMNDDTTFKVPIMAALDTSDISFPFAPKGKGGKLVVHGDSTCFEGGLKVRFSCKDLFQRLLDYMLDEQQPSSFFAGAEKLEQDFVSLTDESPSRMEDSELFKYSKVLTSEVGSSCGWLDQLATLEIRKNKSE